MQIRSTPCIQVPLTGNQSISVNISDGSDAAEVTVSLGNGPDRVDVTVNAQGPTIPLS